MLKQGMHCETHFFLCSSYILDIICFSLLHVRNVPTYRGSKLTMPTCTKRAISIVCNFP